MTWDIYIKGFLSYLKLERSLSKNSIDAYKNDIKKLVEYLKEQKIEVSPEKITQKNLIGFIESFSDKGLSARSQGRCLSGIKTFFKYLLLEDVIKESPAELLETPKIGRKLPEVLSIDEIDEIQKAIDLSKFDGHRNKSIIETLYSCGLRVSELIDLRISNLYFNEGYIRVIGKGNKERLVPLSKKAEKEMKFYISSTRNHQEIKKGHEDFLYLNRNGSKLTRVMIFIVVKKLTEKAGIQKSISPHSFRHSFASHLVAGGADLRAVQEMLGHESILTTEIYTHLENQFLKDNILKYHPRNK